MMNSEKIQRYLQQLPEPLQVEVLHFVEYLLQHAQRPDGDPEVFHGQQLSLGIASETWKMEDCIPKKM